MKALFFSLAALAALMVVAVMIVATSVLHEILAAVIAIGAVICLCAGAMMPGKEKNAPITSSAVRYDTKLIPTAKPKHPSAIKYP